MTSIPYFHHCFSSRVNSSYLIFVLSSLASTGPGATASKRRQLAPTGLLTAKSSHELYGIGSIPKNALVSNGGRPKVATITRVGGRKPMISWVDAPDDVFFVASTATK